ncbi:hypothetical protein LTR85_001318 [Meristemomyces frigidus]|nr:hypothetical protein LTR85_001318 [Meristemomyces frigidus]
MATFSNAGIFGDFTHEPLHDPRRQIRLVQLDISGAEDSDIDCTISSYPTDSAPPYVAVSYTWGDITRRRSIRINGQQLSIGYNSWQALWQRRLHQYADLLWIDVLSIDQANDVEKSAQVSLMGKIYKRARLVFVSVGSHENDSEFLIHQISLHTQYLEQQQWRKYSMDDQLRKRTRFWELSVESHQQCRDALRAFSLRPYWARLWIIQEIRQAKQIVFACGNSIFSWNELWTFLGDVGRNRGSLDVDLETQAKLQDRTVSWYLERIGSLTFYDQDTPDPVWELATDYEAFHCNDDRDRVFGLLSMADERSIEAIKPDYTKSKTAVLLQLLAHACGSANRTGFPSEPSNLIVGVIGGFRLGPDNSEIAGLLQERREKGCNPTSDHAMELQTPALDSVNGHERMPVRVQGYCTLARNKAGHLVAALRPCANEYDDNYVSVDFEKERKTWSSKYGLDGAFEHAQNLATKHASLIHNQNVIVAVAHKDAKPGDVLLHLGYNTSFAYGLSCPSAGMVIRTTAGDRYIIVGQVVYNPEVVPCKSGTNSDTASDGNAEVVGSARCRCDGGEDSEEYHARPDCTWTVHFAPEDLLLFNTQDLHFHVRPIEKNTTPLMDLYVRPEEAAKRLRTNVTSSPFSSYATCCQAS